MAKRRKQYNPDTPVASTTSSETTVETVEVTLRLPLLLTPAENRGCMIRRVEVQNLKHSEQLALRALYDGLVWEGATVTTSLQRPMKSLAADPIRYILQQIAAQMAV